MKRERDGKPEDRGQARTQATGVYGDRGHAMHLVNSHGNAFGASVFAQGDIVLTDSPDNTFPGPGTINLCPVVQQSSVASR